MDQLGRSIKAYHANVFIKREEDTVHLKMDLPDYYTDKEIVELVAKNLRAEGHEFDSVGGMCDILLQQKTDLPNNMFCSVVPPMDLPGLSHEEIC